MFDLVPLDLMESRVLVEVFQILSLPIRIPWPNYMYRSWARWEITPNKILEFGTNQIVACQPSCFSRDVWSLFM